MECIGISIGDVNGIGLEIALKSHKTISKYCKPLYITHKKILRAANKLLCYDSDIIESMDLVEFNATKMPQILPGEIGEDSGLYSFESFKTGVELAKNKEIKALLTLPIHKKAWQKAGIKYAGHTQMLSDVFCKNAIMMLGCEEMFVALFSEHIPLREVSNKVSIDSVYEFLLSFAKSVNLVQSCCVLGLNPHCGDDGVMGDEDRLIKKAIDKANDALNKNLFVGPMPPDSAFTPHNRAKFRYFVSMYHDVGLAPLKALYFESSINISLNLPILRVSVDHGVAFDIAYKNSPALSTQSYLNALKYALKN